MRKMSEREFSAILTKEGKLISSYCPELGVASQGKTQKEAISNLKEAVELYLEEDPVGLPESRRIVAFKARVSTNA